jgi:hypothetical protein
MYYRMAQRPAGPSTTIIGMAGLSPRDNDVYASPALAQPGALTPDGYRIQSASPDAKSGTSLSAGISDFFGNARRVPYSIGANQNNGS